MSTDQEGARLWVWIGRGLHLPRWLRDFHDQKDVFKTISSWNATRVHPARETSFQDSMIYVIDCFLMFMAAHGYTLQRVRGPRAQQCADIAATVRSFKDAQAKALREMLEERAAVDKKEPA